MFRAPCCRGSRTSELKRKLRALEEIATLQRAADERRNQEAERTGQAGAASELVMIQ